MRSGVMFLPVEELSTNPDTGVGAAPPTTGSASPVHLPANGLDKISPCNIVVDRWDRIVSVGPELRDLVGDERLLGELFSKHFVTSKSDNAMRDVRSAGSGGLVLGVRSHEGLRFRGQVVAGVVEDDDVVLHLVRLETLKIRTHSDAATPDAAVGSAEVIGSHSRKLESLGLLVGGIAHDFNNQLAIVTSGLELLRLHEPDNMRLLDRIWDASSRSSALVRQLLDLSGPGDSGAEVIAVDVLLELLGEVLTSTLGPDVRLVLAGGSGLRVFANHDLLVSALLNLVVNARDAMPNGGTLSLNCYAVDNSRLGDVGLASDTNYAAFEVSDEGTGIRAELLEQVFEPFFTTKGQGEGSGLGLSSVHDFATSAGGTIVATKNPDGGTTMTLFLPVDPGVDGDTSQSLELNGLAQGDVAETSPVAIRSAGDPSAPPALAGVRVLVIEDEAELASVFESLLVELGAEPRVVFSVEGARNLLRENQFYRPEYVLSDYYLADGTGEQVMALFGEVRPDTRVVFMSGNIDLRPLVSGIAANHLVKPFSVQELVAAFS